jgi:hypothetical protein
MSLTGLSSASKTVTAPDGRVWLVRRSAPRGPRWWRPSTWDLPWSSTLDAGDGVEGVLAAAVAVVVFALLFGVFVFVVLPAIFFVLDAFLIVGALLLLGGAWIIEASTPGPPPEMRSWRVRGIFASRKAVAEVAVELERGDVDAAPDAATT